MLETSGRSQTKAKSQNYKLEKNLDQYLHWLQSNKPFKAMHKYLWRTLYSEMRHSMNLSGVRPYLKVSLSFLPFLLQLLLRVHRNKKGPHHLKKLRCMRR